MIRSHVQNNSITFWSHPKLGYADFDQEFGDGVVLALLTQQGVSIRIKDWHRS